MEFIINEGVIAPDLNEDLVERWIKDTVQQESRVLGELSVVLMSDDELLKYNQDFLSHDYYTDIITFDYSEKGIISGDLLISLDRVSENAKKLNQELKLELLRVIVHGVLHLMGYKDKSAEDAKEMRAKEDVCLKDYVSRET